MASKRHASMVLCLVVQRASSRCQLIGALQCLRLSSRVRISMDNHTAPLVTSGRYTPNVYCIAMCCTVVLTSHPMILTLTIQLSIRSVKLSIVLWELTPLRTFWHLGHCSWIRLATSPTWYHYEVAKQLRYKTCKYQGICGERMGHVLLYVIADALNWQVLFCAWSASRTGQERGQRAPALSRAHITSIVYLT